MTRRRCAIYTRKSTEDGLEQDFNSLAAQREACEAYILSQKAEGWRLVPTAYDDGGFSGGSLERPALQQLMDDVASGRIDIIVVYKVDRLTRSLADFAKIIEILDAKGASFVSVTQQFNTTTSMGRLTLNVLLSFAQFEREVTAERIRDKIAASKAKGMWMGGNVPLGYRVQERQLVIHSEEAETVRTVFRLYLDLGSVPALEAEAARLNLRSKKRRTTSGRILGHQPLTRGPLYHILRNPLYAGFIRHKGVTYPGQHPALIDGDLWDTVQQRLDQGIRRSGSGHKTYALLKGLLRTEDGACFSTSHARKGDRRYRYYVSKGSAPIRLSAHAMESLVLQQMNALLQDPHRVSHLVPPDALPDALETVPRLAKDLKSGSPERQAEVLHRVISTIRITRAAAHLHLRADGLSGRKLRADLGEASPDHLECTPVIEIPIPLSQAGGSRHMIPGDGRPASAPNEALIRLVAKTHSWADQLTKGEIGSVRDLRIKEDTDPAAFSRQIPLGFLAPDIVDAMLKGDHSSDLTVRRLLSLSHLPIAWTDQRRILGITANK